MALSTPRLGMFAAGVPRAARPGDLLIPARWLPLARVLWVGLVLAGVALIIGGLPGHVARLHLPCADERCAGVGWYLNAAGMGQLDDLGLPVDLYAVVVVGLQLLAAVVYIGMSALIVWRRANEWMALIIAFALLLFGLAGMNFVDTTTTGNAALIGLARAIGALNTPGLAIMLYFLPDGRFRPRWLWGVVAAWCLAWLPDTLAPDSALGVRHWPGWLEPLALCCFFSLAIGVQVWRYRRRSGTVQRQQAKWIVYGITVLLTGHIVIFPVAILGFGAVEGTIGQTIVKGSIYVLFLLLPIAIGLAILRHRLWDIDLVIRRTLVYGVLTACVVGLYAALVAGLGALFRGQGGGLASLLATALVAILFQPLRERLQRGINRLLYGERDDPYAALSQLGRRLEGAIAPGEVPPTIVGAVREALRLPYAAVALAEGPATRIAAQTGAAEQAGTILRLPLLYGEERVGELHLAPRAADEGFSPADRRLLDDLARQAGVAIHAARLSAEAVELNRALQASRERLVTTREEERRRLRRDLHDGLGPQLAGFTLRLDVAQNLLRRDPDTAARILSDLSARTQGVMAEIRQLVYALRPPALDELGLLGALRQHAEAHPPGELCVAVVAPAALPPLSAAVEVAAYRIAQEALTNVVRHAGARSCTVALATEPGALVVTIADDGSGLAPGRRAGVGLHSMRERAAEIGGRCTIEDGVAGGTVVRAWLPFEGCG